MIWPPVTESITVEFGIFIGFIGDGSLYEMDLVLSFIEFPWLKDLTEGYLLSASIEAYGFLVAEEFYCFVLVFKNDA